MQSLPVRGGDGIHNTAVFENLIWSPVALLCVSNTFCRRHNAVTIVIRIGTFNGQCNRFQVIIKRVSCSLSRICDCSFCLFYQISLQKIAACVFSSSSSLDSHKRRTYPVESILAWTDRSLLLLEWRPIKPQSSSNFFSSVGKLSASAIKITCA